MIKNIVIGVCVFALIFITMEWMSVYNDNVVLSEHSLKLQADNKLLMERSEFTRTAFVDIVAVCHEAFESEKPNEIINAKIPPIIERVDTGWLTNRFFIPELQYD